MIHFFFILDWQDGKFSVLGVKMKMFFLQKLRGNTDGSSERKHNVMFRTRYIKILPLTFEKNVSLRVSIHACDQGERSNFTITVVKKGFKSLFERFCSFRMAAILILTPESSERNGDCINISVWVISLESLTI